MGILEKIGALFRFKPVEGEKENEQTPDLLLDGYKSDLHRQGLVTLGREYKPEDVKRFRDEARTGDPRKLYELFDEMVRLGPGPQKTKAVEAMKGASVQFVTCPEEYDDDSALPAGADPQAVANARAARDFLRDTLSERLSDLIEIHSDQDFYGIADSRIRLLPRANAGRWEAIEDIVPIPARRHRLDPVSHEWMLMRSPDCYDGVPVSSVALRADRGLEGVFFTEIGAGAVHLDQRGLLFQCLVPWGIQQFVVRWRAKFIELFGVPPRIGFTDFADPKKTSDMKEMLKSMGSTAYGVFHRSPSSQETDVKLLEAHAASGTNDPFGQQLEWCELAYAMIILGHSQAASVQKGAGSKIPAETAQEQFQNLINSRLRTLAGQIRRVLGRTLVARNLGPAIAARHNPIIRLRYADRDDPNTLAEVALKLQQAGAGQSIAVEDLVRRCTLRVAELGEKSLAAVQPEVGAGQGQQLAAIALGAGRKRERLESFALGLAEGSGEEITSPARILIDRAVAEEWPPAKLLVELVALQNNHLRAPALQDRLAATWAEGIGTGLEDVQRSRSREADSGRSRPQ